MRVFVPRIGTLLRLNQEWTFSVYRDYRNSAALAALGDVKGVYYADDPDGHAGRLTLPTGTVLLVDRVYVRQGINNTGTPSEYDSLSFRVRAGGVTGLDARKRFFARVEDVNTLDVEVITEDPLKALQGSRKSLTKTASNRRAWQTNGRIDRARDQIFQAARIIDAEKMVEIDKIQQCNRNNTIRTFVKFSGRHQQVDDSTLSQSCTITLSHYYSIPSSPLAPDGYVTIDIPARVTFSSDTGEVYGINVNLDGKLNVTI